MKHLALILIALSAIVTINAQSFSQIEYEESDENFANPERGFYHYVSSVDYDQLVSFRENEAITLIYKNYRLDDYTETEIPLWYLQNIEKEFAILRKAGIKAVLRFNYTFSMYKPYGDARPEIVLKHVAQLKPYLQANSDVIYVLQAGFIGAWGEWYYTDYYQSWDDRRELMDALLDAMPASRQVQLRTPNYKQKILESDDYIPISEEEAYTNTVNARVSHHNDCFVAGNNDFGTYQDTAVEKPYLADDTKYALMGGETCNECTCASCENSLLELRRFHWSYINIDYHTAVLQGWKDEGCYPEVERKLGYRYRLVSASVQEDAKPGGTFNLTLKILNDGWANPGNPRDVELILQNNENKEEYYLPLSEDPRLWPLNDTIVISVEAGLPSSMDLANYTTFLNLPDPEPSLAGNPAFSIRTANTETWESSMGYNSLLTEIEIKEDAGLPDYVGGNLFKIKNTVLPDGINILIDGKTKDWEHISPYFTNKSQPAKSIKSYNTLDSIYFLVTGENLQASSQLFIDADLSPETGYAAWQWANNGSDYLIENDLLYKYTGTNHEWGWTEIATVNIATNDTAIELGFDLNELNSIPLQSTFSIGFVNDPNGSVQTSYIPSQNELFLIINQVNIFAPPEALGTTTYSNNNVVFWSNGNASTEVYNILERSGDGDNFEQIQVSQNSTVSFVDRNLEENKSYTYRLNYKSGNTLSDFQGPIEAVTSTNEKIFVNIQLDGDANDWNLIPPSGTGYNEDMLAVRFMNFGSQLYFSLSGQSINNYQLFFDIDLDFISDFKVSNDSLFTSENGNWIFNQTIKSYSSENFLESAIPLEALDFDEGNYLFVTTYINGFAIPSNRDAFTYSKAPVIPTTDFFIADPSSGNYYTNSVIRWKRTENTEGYIIERSDGDTLNFDAVADMAANKTFYVDSDLDSSVVYYYRMFSYNDIYRSVYTPISSMQPGMGLGINDPKRLTNGQLAVAPNPFNGSTKLEINVNQPEDLTVEVYDNMARKVKTLFVGKVHEKKVIEFKRDHLDSGLYFVKVYGAATHITHKIVIN